MRIDLFLKVSRLIVRRTIAQAVCEAGGVTINDVQAKPSREVRTGDLLCVTRNGRKLTVRVLTVPESKSTRLHPSDMYELVSDERLPDKPFS